MKGLKITLNELLFNFSKKILFIVLLAVFISQCSSVLYQYGLLSREKKNLKEVFEEKIVIRLLPKPDSSQATTTNPSEIFSVIKETFGDELYYFNYSSPVSPQMLSLDDVEKKKHDFFANNELVGNDTPLPVLEVNDLQYEKLMLRLAKGEGFQQKDFQEETNVVILGNGYQSIYTIGEEITLSSGVKELFSEDEKIAVKKKYKVIGFLEKNEAVFDFTQGRSDKLKLDDYVLFPTSFDKINQSLSGMEIPIALYVQGIYTMKNKGYDLFLKREELNKALLQKKRSTSLIIQDDNAIFTSKMKLLEEQLSGEMVRFSILFLFLIVCLSSIIGSQISNRGKYFIVYYLIGITLKEIRWSYYLQLVVMYIISFLLYIIYNKFYGNFLYDIKKEGLLFMLVQQFTIFILFSVLSLMIVSKNFRKLTTNNLSQLIKGEKL